jgi:ribosome-associated protein
MAKKTINNDVLLANIIKGIEEVKGNDIDILDLREIDNSSFVTISSSATEIQIHKLTPLLTPSKKQFQKN